MNPNTSIPRDLTVDDDRPDSREQRRAVFIPRIAALLCLVFVSLSHAEFTLLDRVVAIVEDDIVLASEVRDQMNQLTDSMRQRGVAPPSQNVLYEQVLERAILESLQLQRAAKIGMRVSDQQLNETVTRIAGQNKMSLSDFKDTLEKQGDSYVEFREQIRKEILIQEVQRRSVIRNINVSNSEIDNFLNSEQGQLLLSPEFDIDHIMLPVASKATAAEKAQAREQINSLSVLARTGNGFGKIQSDVAAANAQHSPLGWRRKSDIPSLFSSIIDQLQVGEISDAIESGSGYHIIHVREKRGGVTGITTETEVRHILVSPTEIRSSDEAKQLANSVKQLLDNGEDFVALARKYSDDAGSALSGGKLGWTEPGALVSEFQQVMDETPIGETSQAFQTEFGWHILQVTDRREKDMSTDLAQRRARMAIAETKYDDELGNWLQDLRDDAYIEIK